MSFQDSVIRAISIDPFTQLALRNNFDGYASQVLLRQATLFDLKYSVKSNWRYLYNTISEEIFGQYKCDNGLL